MSETYVPRSHSRLQRLPMCEPPALYNAMARRLFMWNYVEFLISLGFNRSGCSMIAALAFRQLRW